MSFGVHGLQIQRGVVPKPPRLPFAVHYNHQTNEYSVGFGTVLLGLGGMTYNGLLVDNIFDVTPSFTSEVKPVEFGQPGQWQNVGFVAPEHWIYLRITYDQLTVQDKEITTGSEVPQCTTSDLYLAIAQISLSNVILPYITTTPIVGVMSNLGYA